MKSLLIFALALFLVQGSNAPALAQEQVTVRFLAGSVGIGLQLSQESAERYMEENPDVTIEIVDGPESASDRYGLYLQFFEAQSPEIDVIEVDVIWPGDLAEHLVDLNEHGADAEIDQFFPAIVENNTVEGALVSIPWYTDAGHLYYRTDLLETYGYDGPPQTWDELEEMAQTIQEGEREGGNSDFVGFVWQGQNYEGLTCDALEWIASAGGGTVISPDGVITVNNDRAARMLERAAGWVGTISPSGVTGFMEEDARRVFQAGNAAFMRNWPYAYTLAQGEDSAVAGNFGVSALPAAEGGSPAAALGGWNLGVSRYSRNVEAAADFALFLASEAEQKFRAVEGTQLPTRMALYEDPEVLEVAPFFGDLYDVFINATPRPSTVSAPNYNQVSTLFSTAAHNVLTGTLSAEDALADLEIELEALTGFPVGEPDDASSQVR